LSTLRVQYLEKGDLFVNQDINEFNDAVNSKQDLDKYFQSLLDFVKAAPGNSIPSKIEKIFHQFDALVMQLKTKENGNENHEQKQEGNQQENQDEKCRSKWLADTSNNVLIAGFDIGINQGI